MPRAVFQVQGAPNKTRWTLTRGTSSASVGLHSPTVVDDRMQSRANGRDYEQDREPIPRLEPRYNLGFDSSTTQPTNSTSGRPAPQPAQLNGASYDDYDYPPPADGRAGHEISLNTRLRSHNQDAMGRHLLYETALMDTHTFEILDIREVDELKQEHSRLNSRIEAAERKLALESKVKDAAQNLQRLYSSSGKSRPDTPQSPDSVHKSGRRSLLGQRRSSGVSGTGETLFKAEDELSISRKKVDELNEVVKELLERRQYAEKRLLRHTAAVLAEQQTNQDPSAERGLVNGHDVEGDDSSSIYTPDAFDGIRDILIGRPAGSINKLQKRVPLQKLQQEHEQQLQGMQNRLEHLNQQLRNVISEASRIRGKSLPPEPEADPEDKDGHEHDTATYVSHHFGRLEHNLRTLEQEQHDNKAHYARLQESEYQTRKTVEQQLAGLNDQLHNTLLLSPAAQSIPNLQDPPAATGHGYQHQVQYLGTSLINIERVIQQNNEELQSARKASGGVAREVENVQRQLKDAQGRAQDAHAKASTLTQKLEEYDSVLGGLWEIVQSDLPDQRLTVDRGIEDEHGQPSTGIKESFSLQAFSARVQHMFDRVTSAKEQQDILRRQIQQQKESNGKSDAEKDKHFAEFSEKHEALTVVHGQAEENLIKAVAQASQSEAEASRLRAELLNVENEFDQLRRTVEARQGERDESVRQLETHKGAAAGWQEQIESLEAQIAELTDDARIFTAQSDSKLRYHEIRHADLTSQLAEATSSREAAEQKHQSVQKDMESLESEVVRLTTELTFAKAELDGAYGSRAERAKEAQAAEVAALNERNKHTASELQSLREQHESLANEVQLLRSAPQDTERTAALERELHDMTNEYQQLTRESIELEKEREQLDALIEGLGDRCEALESQLSDEKVRWLGVKSPSGLQDPSGRETTSTLVLRQEFKKMMRETRAEGVKLLRAEQEERRKVEAELRRVQQANGALGRASANGANPAALPNGVAHAQ